MKNKLPILIFILFCFLFLGNSIHAFSSTSATTQLIFDKLSVDKDEEFSLKINLNRFSELYHVTLNIKFDNNLFEPVSYDGKYFQFAQNRIFGQPYSDDIIIQKLTDNEILQLILYKGKDISNGYDDVVNHNIAEVTFISHQNIDDLSDYFQFDNYYTSESGINLSLKNPIDETISFGYEYVEKLAYQWSNSYEIEVFSEFPNFQDDIIILNRSIEEYSLELLNTGLDNTRIGTQIVQISVQDIVTGERIPIAKYVNIVDKTSPELEVEEEVKLKDWELNSENLLFANAIDNYDSTINIVPTYYDGDGNELGSEADFLIYLSTHLAGKIVFNATDQSGNKAIPVETNLTIEDTTPPVISNLNDITLLDTEMEDFRFESLITISDAYDSYPIFALYALDSKLKMHEDYLEVLQKEKEVIVCYFAKDKFNNTSETFQTRITIEDTTPPILSGIEDLNIIDSEVVGYPFSKDLIVTDNFDESLVFYQSYYLDESLTESVSYQMFMEKILRGVNGYIVYGVDDLSGNSSDPVVQKITVIDKTAPAIIVNEVKDGKKYFNLSSITYQVSDNFDGEIDIEVYLNNESYDGSAIEELGTYKFMIIATDISGNATHEEYNFSIISRSLIGCGGDLECYFSNYFPVVIIVCSLLIFAIILTTLQIVHRYRHRIKITS